MSNNQGGDLRSYEDETVLTVVRREYSAGCMFFLSGSNETGGPFRVGVRGEERLLKAKKLYQSHLSTFSLPHQKTKE